MQNCQVPQTLGNYLYAGKCFMFNLLKINSFEKMFRNTIRVSNSLDPDQARQNVRPDLDPNYQQRTKG